MTGKLTILGCGSARPTKQNSPTGQLVELCDKSFLVDCGEGVQITMQRLGVHTSRLYTIFISHLHGDHCFGLMGLLSTLGMLHRTQPMHIYAHADLEKLLRPWLDYYCPDLPYEVCFHAINPRKREVIFEDRTVTVETIPLKHTVPCCGFLFSERHRVLAEDSGEKTVVVRKRYAYCSDTMYSEKILPIIEGVDTLYHEATYLDEFADRCRTVMHSTARQAAAIAQKAHAGKLIIGHFSARVLDHNLFLQEAQSVFANTVLAQEQTTMDI
ncbi:MAG: ribonuclease Z [Paludibacteraceae bacterium]